MTSPAGPQDATPVFAAALHRLASSLGAVANYGRLLEELAPEDPDGLRSGLRRATRGAQRVLGGGTRWLDAVERLGPLEPVDPLALLERARAALDAPDLTVAIEPAAPQVVRAAPEALELVFEELLRNAVQASGGAPTRVRITRRGDGAFLVLSVADRGVGWSPEQVSRAFLPFTVLDPAAERAGMGLSIVDTLVRAMGGRARGAPGEPDGAIVHLWLPQGA